MILEMRQLKQIDMSRLTGEFLLVWYNLPEVDLMCPILSDENEHIT